jgi:uncharacterized iron-regulated protein
MKKLLVLFGFILIYSSSIAKGLDAYVIYDKKGKTVDFGKMMKATENKKFIFFGEFHNNPISHWLQLELTKHLYAVHKKRLVLGAEMFEADNQYIIDEYLKSKISSKNFQKEVRLWPNYDTDYKPLVEFAKERGLPFIATNIPRRYASMAYKQGLDSLKSLSDMAKSYIVPLDQFVYDSTVNCYSKMITDFGDHGGTEIAFAQAIKDATMAHFILKNIDNKSVFVHYNGAYHSDNYEGIVYYLKKEKSADKILTISTVSQTETEKLEEQYLGTADFIICVPDNMTKTH